jgi:hypothetical protein
MTDASSPAVRQKKKWPRWLASLAPAPALRQVPDPSHVSFGAVDKGSVPIDWRAIPNLCRQATCSSFASSLCRSIPGSMTHLSSGPKIAIDSPQMDLLQQLARGPGVTAA